MKEPKTWYDRGFHDATETSYCNPPYQPGHKAYELYMSGYHDGQRQVEIDYEQGSRAYSGVV